MDNFDGLLNDMEKLNKAIADEGGIENHLDDDGDDEKIRAAADDDGVTEAEEEEEGADGEQGEMVMKAMNFRDAEGKEVEAFDGTELVQSLIKRQKSSDARLEKAMKVSLENQAALANVIKQQSKLIKSMQDDFRVVAESGRGRKSTLSVHEKQDLNKSLSDKDGMSAQEFRGSLRKAMTAGRITGHEASLAETYLNNGQTPPSFICDKVLAA